MVAVRVLADSINSFTIEVVGMVASGDTAALNLTNSRKWRVPAWVRLDSVQHAIQDGLTCFLWWEHAKEHDSLIMPLAGRGLFPPAHGHTYQNPEKHREGHTGDVILTTDGVWPEGEMRAFSLIIDFEKQRERVS